MKITIKKEIEVKIKTLHVKAGVRYWDDTRVNGKEDEKGDLIPCRIGHYGARLLILNREGLSIGLLENQQTFIIKFVMMALTL